MTNLQEAEWCEANLGRVVEHEGQEAILRSYTFGDGLCWTTLELPGGSTLDCALSALGAWKKRSSLPGH